MSVLPGNPNVLEQHINVLNASASLLEEAVIELQRLEFEMCSLAVTEIKTKSVQAATALNLVKTRHRGSSIALKTYSASLRTAQQKADHADQQRAYHQYLEREAANQMPGLRNTLNNLHANNASNILISRAEEALQSAWVAQQTNNETANEATEAIERARRDLHFAADEAINGIKEAISETNDGALEQLSHLIENGFNILNVAQRWAADFMTATLQTIIETAKVIAFTLLFISGTIVMIALAFVAVDQVIPLIVSLAFKIILAAVILAVSATLLWEITRPALDVQEYEKPKGTSEASAQRRRAQYLLLEQGKSNHRSVSDFMLSQEYIDRAGVTETSVIDIKQMSKDPAKWVVTLPSTQALMGGAANDWAHNVSLKLMPWYETQFEKSIREAMRKAGISPTDAVAVVGFSQGGILAARLASNEHSGFNITRVVTAGAPTSDIKIPTTSTNGSDVKVVSFVHDNGGVWKNDPVWGFRNPLVNFSSSDHWKTYSVATPDGETFTAAHDANLYAATASKLAGEDDEVNKVLEGFYGVPLTHSQYQATE